MRWSIVGLIFRRELVDQLRDRRTLFMIVVLPILLYPIAGIGLMQLALGFLKKQHTLAIVRLEQLPSALGSVQTAGTVIGLTSGHPLAATLAPALALREVPPARRIEGPPFRLLPHGASTLEDADELALQPVESREMAQALLDDRRVDLIVEVEDGFVERMENGERPALLLIGRNNDERSRLAEVKLNRILQRYREVLKGHRLTRLGLPADYDQVFRVTHPEQPQEMGQRAADELFRVMAQIFPFVLVMWSLAGALYPAVDLCAGEKERGTMETLLISPASREEIVWGKFLTIWLFSGATALLNLISMGMTTWYFSLQLPESPFRPAIFVWGTLLLLPLSAFFSAVSLAIGVYARSSKEGQYYLMPLFFFTMPLVFITLAPGVELNAFYSMVPVTGVALLMKDLLLAESPSLRLATYFVPVLAPMVIYSWLALRWAIEQFQREEVLFREAEQVDLHLWFRNLFREKEALPSAGMAFGCFALVLLLFQLVIRLPVRTDLQVHLLIAYLACVLTPTLMMAVILTTRPLLGLLLRPFTGRDAGLAVGLAALLVIPGALATRFILENVPGLKENLREHLEHPAVVGAGLSPGWLLWMQLALLVPLVTAVCEELTFRGLILTGLSRYFRPVGALFLSSFLFAIFHMNVFQSIPHFLLGLVLGVLTQRTGSVGPAIVLHLTFNALLGLGLGFGPRLTPEVFDALSGEGGWPTLLGWGCCVAGLLGVAFVVLGLLRRPLRVPAEVA